MNELEKYKEMHNYIKKSYAECLEKLNKLKQTDKTKSATYRQLVARKLRLEDMLSYYKMFDLM